MAITYSEPLLYATPAGWLSLSTTTRTLRRRLDAEGAAWGPLKDAVRRELSMQLLADAALTVDEIVGFVGGVIPKQDYEFLYDAGVKGIYGPGTPIPASAKDVLEQIKKSLNPKA